MGRVEGKVVLITGAARGQGRSHAVRLAQEGAHIIASDICEEVGSTHYSLATSKDLEETRRLVEKEGGKILTFGADVRELDQMEALVAAGLEEFGQIDVVIANAGIGSLGRSWELTEKQWRDMIDVNLTGAWHTIRAAVPHMIDANRGGSIIFTNSVAGTLGRPNMSHYAASKHGLVGLMRSLANELAPYFIRVNSIHPGNVDTDMVQNNTGRRLLLPDVENPSREEFAAAATELSVIPVPWVDSIDISNAVLWLASDEARYVTGATLPVDAGAAIKA
ncbi:mycofactocin-coupled SDR family oxidoreductase [Streptomyces capoamus]|uniref:Short chain dehydrogenase/reductase n=1 Tax=Streptomyces capoamus TaxID=68183 RepID=A0A919C1U2_9ACTN|nr:mycofactocin-coupled SDR family oxidoreductase [Streptomyces capoamus]GGW13849.1 putative short chain dehydrogenase/reductase [Streptomyces libani subsp. rufus]GHG40714.1 putative short chain dehydrogenase/reductase [Streptomyces capoamus]